MFYCDYIQVGEKTGTKVGYLQMTEHLTMIEVVASLLGLFPFVLNIWLALYVQGNITK